jgi:hypothetical protein
MPHEWQCGAPRLQIHARAGSDGWVADNAQNPAVDGALMEAEERFEGRQIA